MTIVETRNRLKRKTNIVQKQPFADVLKYCDIFKSSFFHRPLPVNTSQDIFDSDAPRCSMKKFLKNFERLTGKHLYQSLFLNKVAGLGPATLLKKKLHTGVFLRIFKNTFFHGARLVAASADCQKKNVLKNSLKTFFEIEFHWFATIDSGDF